MAVKLITTIQNYIGLSSDTKPTGVSPGSRFWAYDTDQNFITYNGTDWSATGATTTTLKSTTIDLAQAAGNYDLFTANTQDIIIRGALLALPNINVSNDATITSISVQTNDATPQVIFTSIYGAKANLTASAQLSWDGGFILLAATKKIQLTINGGAADAATVCKVTVEYTPVTAGGYLS